VTEPIRREETDVVVVGGGPGGLAAARACRALGVERVVVLEREAVAGGIPRHSQHTGYGLRDLGRVLTGPAYADRWLARAQSSGVDVRTAHTVTMLSRVGDRWQVLVTAPSGRWSFDARAVVMATGCRERPRSARLIPGDRGAGVYATGTLQQLVNVEHLRPGTRALVVGAEHVSYSAAVTLAHAQCDVVAMVTTEPRPTTFGAFRRAADVRWRFPVRCSTQVTRINGRERVESVELTDLVTGRTERVACDTVILTGDWVADHELVVTAGVVMDAASTGPRVDTSLRTSAPGLFASGNLTHPAETADVCALEGGAVGHSVVAWLAGGWWPAYGTEVTVSDPLTWVSPSFVTDAGTPPRSRFVLRASEFLRRPQLQVAQGDRLLWRGRVPWLIPTRPVYVPASWLGDVDTSPASRAISITVC